MKVKTTIFNFTFCISNCLYITARFCFQKYDIAKQSP